MQVPRITFIKTHEDAKLPQRNNKEPLIGDSGYDIYAVEDAIIPAQSTEVVQVGLEIGYIEPGYWIRVESRSGLYFKHRITSFFGIIDNGLDDPWNNPRDAQGDVWIEDRKKLYPFDNYSWDWRAKL